MENLMGVDPKLNKGPESNHTYVLQLIKEIGNNISDFQAETEVEDRNIVAGLKNIIDIIEEAYK